MKARLSRAQLYWVAQLGLLVVELGVLFGGWFLAAMRVGGLEFAQEQFGAMYISFVRAWQCDVPPDVLPIPAGLVTTFQFSMLSALVWAAVAAFSSTRVRELKWTLYVFSSCLGLGILYSLLMPNVNIALGCGVASGEFAVALLSVNLPALLIATVAFPILRLALAIPKGFEDRILDVLLWPITSVYRLLSGLWK